MVAVAVAVVVVVAVVAVVARVVAGVVALAVIAVVVVARSAIVIDQVYVVGGSGVHGGSSPLVIQYPRGVSTIWQGRILLVGVDASPYGPWRPTRGEPMTAPDVSPRAADTHDGVARVASNGIEIAYESFGDPADPTILLVMGLGTQMLAWPDELCEALADAGHHVVRFDNRDVGLSTHIDAPAPGLLDILRRRPAYTIGDMADDAVGLLDALDVERAHVVGASMGGFISQTVALHHPERVETLSLIMTSTGSMKVGRPTPHVMRMMASRAMGQTREEAMDGAVDTYRIIGSPDHLDEDLVRELAGLSFDRSYDPGGAQRQLAAIMAQPDRTRALGKLQVPTLVVHGLADPLVTVSGGLAIARAIPNATFIGHSGMGHDLPRTMWPSLRDDIVGLIGRNRRVAT